MLSSSAERYVFLQSPNLVSIIQILNLTITLASSLSFVSQRTTVLKSQGVFVQNPLCCHTFAFFVYLFYF